ncbi:hypothetical protein UA08_06365 [Talaromyces atroroseus]|uniref:Carrier domain-containing protein n=1 Tax=Talaromyces atroroseus TaxID=1441469 RepID=A0A225AJE4_TALAT|nr:hypothetical protein UA08_06365 [Talaromyces atroroseus]OKL58374.1 hypothetical protein UA08_06365 [Talaromyces atroroseus]
MAQSSSSDLEYWILRLQDKESCLFPPLLGGVTGANKSQYINLTVPSLSSIQGFCKTQELRLSTIFQTAWALVLRSYMGTNNICFGFQTNSIRLLPCNFTLARETSLKHALELVEAGLARDLSHIEYSLEELEHALGLQKTGLFNTIITYQDSPLRHSPAGVNRVNGQVNGSRAAITNGYGDATAPSSRYPIEIRVNVSTDSISVQLKYQQSALSDASAMDVASALEMALGCVLDSAAKPVGEQSLFSPKHQRQVDEWNQGRPESINMTIHEAISDRAQTQPVAPAINAWDEKWTYQEIDELSSALALHLVNIGVKTGMKVPLLFERSGWWVIALLAISKAGAAFVPVDPTQPVFRLKEIVEDIEPKFLLSSAQYAELLADVVETCVVVSQSSMKKISSSPGPILSLPKVSADAHAYVLFTSGSTGALWCGACLCIPSDHTKLNDFAGIFNDMGITWAILSPSIIKSVQPEVAPSLRNLVLCGEPVSKEVISKWASRRTKVWVFWGSTESVAICRPDHFTADSDVQNLGPCKGVCRVVDINNPDLQVPIGAVGEIVIHSPWIAEGYLRDPERTARTFLDRPDWLNGIPSAYGSRWYRVGDLVRQNSDGTLMLAGRKDNMIKIRGQRIDMSEIERNLASDDGIRNSLPVLPKVGICKHRLVSVIALHQFSPTNNETTSDINILRGSELQAAASWVSNFRERLAERLPSYAIPTIWVMVKSIPLTITGKIDRLSVKQFVERMDVDTYEEVSMLGVKREPPVTAMEKRLQSIWSSVLGLPLDKIGRNQTFISLGGDSTLAMILVAKCRSSNLNVRVEDIMKLGTISEIAQHAIPATHMTDEEATATENYDQLRNFIKDQLHQVGVTDLAEVEDAYPCSPMQQGMILSKARLTGDYNTSTIHEIVPRVPGSSLSSASLRQAWQRVVDRHSSLRTFFVESVSQSGSFDQVVLRKYDIQETTTILETVASDSKEDVVKTFKTSRPGPYRKTRPPHNFTILPTTSGRLFFRLNVEHTVVDGTSIAVIVRDLNLAYNNNLPMEPPALYSSYIASLQRVVPGVDSRYWKGYLDGMNPCLLPNLTYSLSRTPPKAETQSLVVDIKDPHHLLKFCQSQDITLSALFRAIWGLVLQKYTGSDDVCFGYITSGRDIPVDGIDELVGTLINMLVCRMKFENSLPFRSMIATSQADYLASLYHQHASLAQIHHELGLYGQRLFNTSMTVLKEPPRSWEDGSSYTIRKIHQFSPDEYDLSVQAWVSDASVRMELWYRTECICNEQAMNIASTFTKALETITDNPDQRIGQLDLFSDQHRQQVRDWNSKIPETIQMCLHDMVTAQSKRRPGAVAVTSWDRDLTWSELETYADQIAFHLVSLGVGPEIHVMICFEKSALAIVAMLGVLKAGGVVVSIDSSHPIQRLQHIIKDTRPLCCLVSPFNADLFKNDGLIGLVPHIVLVQESLFLSASLSRAASSKACPEVRPENAAFVLFTSGSTGTPKGIVHEHRAIASSLEHHGKAMDIGVESRTMQFSAFVFDVSITEIFMSLTRGGVLCIPSEDERMNNLELAFTRMKANWAHLTPTVASLLDSERVPSLKHLVLAGETLKKANLTEWAPRLELVNLYGPAECALASTLRVGCEKDDRPDNIGQAVGLLVWIVDPSNTDHLVPVGAVGEILLEGPNLAREYLKDKERTVESFIENPAWLSEEKAVPARRFYRSGDLARYNSDGSIQILGRIDTQVKLHGQRVELGEIEYQVKLNLSSHGLVNMAVVHAHSAGHPGGGLLAVFLEFEAKTTGVDEDQLMLAISPKLRKLLVKLNICLEDTLPSYMVPSMYIPLNKMPLLTSGKIDRGKLTGIVIKLPTEQVKLYSLSEFQDEKAKPRTRMERILHKLWSQTLGVDGASIGINDSFFRLGGDSVVAMQLSAAGRIAGITITVASIFQHPKFCDMAAVAKPLNETTYQDLKRRYGIEGDVVQKFVPCTPLQEGLMLLSNKQPGTYVAQHIFHLRPDTNTNYLCKAWGIVHNAYDILRTRIIPVENTIGSVQVVLNENIMWQRSTDLDQYLKDDRLAPVSYGQPLTRYALVEEADSGNRYFVWTAHHSVFDNWSLSLLFSELADVYTKLVSGNANITPPQSMPFHDFANQVFNDNIADAEVFWNAQFEESVFSSFPKLPTGHQALADTSLDYSLALSGAVFENKQLLATIVQVAWAILLAQYSDSPNNVVFGMTLDGRVDSETSNVMGPTIATVPFSMSLDYQLTIEELLKRVQQQTSDVQRFQHFGVQNIKKVSQNAERACDFQSLLAVQGSTSDYAVKLNLFADTVVRAAPSTYLLLLDCRLTHTGVDMIAQYDKRITPELQMKRILQQFGHVIRELLAGYGLNKRLADIELCSPQDTKDILAWNQNIPAILDMCVHEVIANHSIANPDAMAVCSWDESLTYRKLNQLSTTLAHQLVSQFHIGPESLVPLLFTQSAWTVVAMLAVLKAGGGYVPMDPSYPSSRLQEIVNATQASLILCSPQHNELSQSLATSSLVVSGETINRFSLYEGVVCRNVHSRNVAYVIFTPIACQRGPLIFSSSGSTGTPKGVVMEHGSFCTAATHHGKRLNLNSQSRVIHFSSYAFEACILEILTTLFNGGCICVAPESERLGDITKTMREFHVNWAFFTPSFIRTIHPDQVPSLKTLVLGGEALGADNIDVWVDRVFLVNGYGPSETCVFSVINEQLRRGIAPDLIGSPIGGACWIVDPENHHKLVPVGCVGELLIEGPTVARGYLNDPGRSQAVFVDRSKWLAGNSSNVDYKQESRLGTTSRMYKTGDLVCYKTSPGADGSIRIVGRKDAQVKIRGQRTEIGDIEYHLTSKLSGIKQISVEYVAVGGHQNRQLAAFFPLNSETLLSGPGMETSLPVSMPDDLKRVVMAAKAALSDTLPMYMIPTLYITLSRMPLLSSGKMDRRKLRDIASRLSGVDISHYSLADKVKRKPITENEMQMADLWRHVLGLTNDEAIGLDDSFFGLGGDSISAMKLTALARENKTTINVAQIFQNPRLEDMAQVREDLDDSDNDMIEPFSLIRGSEGANEETNILQSLQQIYCGDIEDAFPCGPLQEGLMLLSIKHPGSYMSQIILRLQPHVDIDRFKRAWQSTADRNSVLRTRITHVGSQCIQFITREELVWRHQSGLEEFLAQDKKELMGHGSPLVRYAVVDNEAHQRYFILTAHHSLYDGWSLMLIMEELDRLYNDSPVSNICAPYAGFIRHLNNIDSDSAKQFWKSQFANKSLGTFPDPRTVTPAKVETQLSQLARISRPAGSEITLSTVIRAAWALVTARYAETNDVFFGATLMGRNASLPNIERMTGPTITTVPVCVSINNQETVGTFLRQIQADATEMMPYEHTGLQNIKRLGPEAETACSFQNLLVIQPEGSEHMSSNLWEDNALFAKGEMVVLTYALIIECRLYKDEVRITTQYRDHIIPTRQMQRIMDQFEGVLQQLNNAAPNTSLGNIDICSQKDKEEVRRWNESYMDLMKSDACIHHLIERQATERPNAPAIDSWDTSFTYEELDKLSTALANHLSALGVGTGTFVPLCFDKSAWTIVAILAVLKAGAAYVPLDPKHPKARKDHIIQYVSAKVILTGTEYRNMFDSSLWSIVVVDQELESQLRELPKAYYGPGSPSNAAFIVFTSGSTGMPKGIVMEHGPFCSSSREHSKALLINQNSRVMQFAAYTYDVSMGEILSTLIHGGCVCVPSEEDRLSRLALSINALKVNWIFLTPTVAALLNPEDVPGLKTMVLGGEHATAENFKSWASHLYLINSYGPAECAIWCACAPGVSPTSDPSNIGRQVGASLWVIEPTNPHRLAPIGCVGELVVIGPTLAREYLNDPAKTAAAFLESPQWADGVYPTERRMYRTGDLARYGTNGNILIVGRRDTQVKLHGQRVELGEIEHQVMQCAPPGWFPIVQMLNVSVSGKDATLTAFIHIRKDSAPISSSDVMTLSITDAVKTALSQLRSDLEQVLPSHMVPLAFIPVSHIPLTAGGKVDRGVLRKFGESLTKDQLRHYFLVDQTALRLPSTEMEKRLHSLWVRVLGVDPGSVGAESNFLRIGGDSVAAMRLSAAAREDDISLAVRDIFSSPRLEDMSKAAAPISLVEAPGALYTPFSSLGIRDLPQFLETVVYPRIANEPDEIEDILRGTDYQRWVLGCGQLKTRGYNNYLAFRFKGALDLSRLRTACSKILERHAILRTVFIAYKRQLFQVVLKHLSVEFIELECSDEPADRRSIFTSDMALPVSLAQTSIQFIFVKYGPNDNELLMRVSHGLYDGISLPILVQDLKAAYCGEDFSSSLPYSAFIHGSSQTTDASNAESFWREELKGSVMTNVLNHSKPPFSNLVNKSLKRTVAAPSILSQGITFATAVKVAWAFVLAQLSGRLDVVFGQTTTGRNAPIQGIDKIVGPCMNLIPIRVKLDPQLSISEIMLQVQNKHLDISAYELLGFQNIIEKCTTWPNWTRMSSILQHTNFNVGMDDMDLWGNIEMHLGNFTPDHDVSDIWIWTGPAGEEFYVDFTYSSRSISESIAQSMCDLLCETLTKISEHPHEPASVLLSDTKPLLPLPLPESHATPAASANGMNHQNDERIEVLVQSIWSKVFGDENDRLPNGVTMQTPFFEIRGDLLAAAQIAMEYEVQGFQVTPEDIIENASMALQVALLSLL